jgi:hypothetical protein
VADGLIPRNAADAVKPPQVSKEEIRPLTAEQAKILFEAVRGDRLEALYVLAITRLGPPQRSSTISCNTWLPRCTR